MGNAKANCSRVRGRAVSKKHIGTLNQYSEVILGFTYNKKIMSPAGGLGHKQAGGFAIIACLFVPHI